MTDILAGGVWPRGAPTIGQRAERTCTVGSTDRCPGTSGRPVRPGDVITGAVEVTEVREDRPIVRLRTTVTRGDGVLTLEGDALCYTVPV